MLKIPKSPKEGLGNKLDLRDRRKSQGITNKSQPKGNSSAVKS